MDLHKLVRSLLVCSTLVAGLMLLTSGGATQSVAPVLVKSTSYDKGDYVGSDTCQACHEEQFKAYAHTAHAQLTRLRAGKTRSPAANHATVPARRTSTPTATRPRSSASRTSRLKKSQRIVSAVTPARKSATTSAAASTGATMSVARIVTRPTQTPRAETSPARTLW